MLGRLTRSSDFVRALGRPAFARSPHFAVHYAEGTASRERRERSAADLSTDSEQNCPQAVDDLQTPTSAARLLLGAVVPKRHARRAVTRSLLKRQIRDTLARRAAASPHDWPAGIWVVRLRAPFDRDRFPSADSRALRSAARTELEAVFDGVQRRLTPGARGS